VIEQQLPIGESYISNNVYLDKILNLSPPALPSRVYRHQTLSDEVNICQRRRIPFLISHPRDLLSRLKFDNFGHIRGVKFDSFGHIRAQCLEIQYFAQTRQAKFFMKVCQIERST